MVNMNARTKALTIAARACDEAPKDMKPLAWLYADILWRALTWDLFDSIEKRQDMLA